MFEPEIDYKDEEKEIGKYKCKFKNKGQLRNPSLTSTGMLVYFLPALLNLRFDYKEIVCTVMLFLHTLHGRLYSGQMLYFFIFGESA